MKQLILTLAFFASFCAIAQDGYHLPESSYQNIFKQVNQLNSESARQFADRIVGASQNKYEFLVSKTQDDSATFYYVEAGLSPEQLQEQKDMGCTKCMRVNFTVYQDRFVFLDVTGSLPDLLPTWTREFIPSATPELIQDSFKYRTVKDRTTGVDVRLTEKNGVWQIYNWSI